MSIQEHVNTVKETIATAARAAGRDPEEVTCAPPPRCRRTIPYVGPSPRDHSVRREPGPGAHRPPTPLRLCGGPGPFYWTPPDQQGQAGGGKAALIHSVDSQRLLQAIDSQAGKLGLVQDILLEVNIAGEESKGAARPGRRRSWPPWPRGWTMCACGGLMAIPPISPEPGANRPFLRLCVSFLLT